ncbi:transposase [Streptomyces europaeiscabiei]|uniref:transposase n=1 Tax=Streptomyces europaeiscabiei TaxID=146819 RepID=UPI0038D40631
MLDRVGPGWRWVCWTGRRPGCRPCQRSFDSSYGPSATFRLALEERGWSYLMAVDPNETARPAAAEPFNPIIRVSGSSRQARSRRPMWTARCRRWSRPAIARSADWCRSALIATADRARRTLRQGVPDGARIPARARCLAHRPGSHDHGRHLHHGRRVR